MRFCGKLWKDCCDAPSSHEPRFRCMNVADKSRRADSSSMKVFHQTRWAGRPPDSRRDAGATFAGPARSGRTGSPPGQRTFFRPAGVWARKYWRSRSSKSASRGLTSPWTAPSRSLGLRLADPDQRQWGRSYLGAGAKTSNSTKAPGHLKIAAIGPATRRGDRGAWNESECRPQGVCRRIRSCKSAAKGKREAGAAGTCKVARDVIPRELRKLGARVDVVEAYETIVPQSSRKRLRAALDRPERRPERDHIHQFLDRKEFCGLLGKSRGRGRPRHTGRTKRCIEE